VEHPSTLDVTPAPRKNCGMASPRERSDAAGARHSEGWYVDTLSDRLPHRGDRMFIRCEGGPCSSRLETFPPRIEIQERGGLYVLVDDGPPGAWVYQFVATAGRDMSL
jgi:hypothetical protein